VYPFHAGASATPAGRYTELAARSGAVRGSRAGVVA
jgi:hypothetical protein